MIDPGARPLRRPALDRPRPRDLARLRGPPRPRLQHRLLEPADPPTARPTASGYRVDGEPLRFFHFSGFDPRRPDDAQQAPEPDRGRRRSGPRPDLRRATPSGCSTPATRRPATWPYGWSTLPNGIWLDRAARRALPRKRSSGDELRRSVFAAGGAKRFVAYLQRGPAGTRDQPLRAGALGLPADLRAASPTSRTRRRRLRRWPRLQLRALARSSRQRGRAARAPAASRSGSTWPATSARSWASARRPGRSCGAGRAQTSRHRDRRPGRGVDAGGARSGRLGPETRPFDVNLICVNADMLPAFAGAARPSFFEGRHTAGLWFWEVEQFPERWPARSTSSTKSGRPPSSSPTRSRRVSPVPVSTIRVPITAGAPRRGRPRRALGLPDGFCFLFVFDYRSVLRRKNPLGLIEAFRSAFEPGVGRLAGDQAHQRRRARPTGGRARRGAADHPDIHCVDGIVSARARRTR